MSFKCGRCGAAAANDVRPRRVVVEQREKLYTERRGDDEVVIGQGREIVREENWCPDCWLSGEETC